MDPLFRGAPLFAVSECVLIRILEEIWVEGYVENEATAVGTDLPPVGPHKVYLADECEVPPPLRIHPRGVPPAG
jgi:hypothetical protein